MTIDERAKKVVDEFCGPGLDAIPKGDKTKTWLFMAEEERLKGLVTSAIREAVEAEREECENIAKDSETLSAAEWERYYGKNVTVVDAIRKRGETK